MNKKIFELAEQASETARQNNPYWRMPDELPEDKIWREKFAELIIRECGYVWLMNPEGHPNLLLDHFEVEQ